MRVDVLEACSRDSCRAGEVVAKWELGASGTASLGAVVWFTEEEHVSGLTGSGVGALLAKTAQGSGEAAAPWCRSSATSIRTSTRCGAQN